MDITRHMLVTLWTTVRVTDHLVPRNYVISLLASSKVQ